MKYIATFLLFLLPVFAEAQTVAADRFRLNTGPCIARSGSGTPEAVIIGNVCDTFHRTDTGVVYYKISGTGNTGWIAWTSANTASYLVSRDGSGGFSMGALLASSGTFSGLTSGRVTFASTSGLLAGDTDLTFATDTLTATRIIVPTSLTVSSLIPNRVPFLSTGGLFVDDSDLTFSTDTLTTTKAIIPSSLTTPFVFGYSVPASLSLGGTGGTCAGYPACEANDITLDTSVITQRLRTDLAYRSQWYTSLGGTHLNSSNASGWNPLRLSGGPTRIGGGGLHVGTTDTLDPGLGNTNLDGFIGKPGYVSQTTGWRIDGLGAADFRYLYTDELHAKKFIADLEQALAGLQIIAKSVGQIGAVFTVPAPGSVSTLTMRDLPSAENMAIFESGDYLWIRQFSRASGSLTITNAYGIATSYADLADGLQTWQFTRLITNGGAASTGAQIEVDSIVLDVGMPGNGWVETNAIDGLYGVNSPYQQVVTWSGNSPISNNQTLRTRLGNLRGITGVTGEYGLIAGTYAATNGAYLRASNQAFELHGIDLKLWNGTTNVFRLDHTTPYESMGTPAPTTFSAGNGFWSGIDGGVFKWRIGNPTSGSNLISWDGSILSIVGAITVTGTVPDANNALALVGTPGATVVSGAALGTLGIDSVGNPLIPAAATPSAAKLYLSSSHMGYYNSGWKTYMDSSGNFYLGGTGGNLQYTAATGALAISGSITITGGSGYANISDKPTLGTVSALDTVALGTNTSGGYALSASEGGSAADTVLVDGTAAATVKGGAVIANLGLNSSGVVKLPVAGSFITGATGVTGLNLTSTYLGYYDGAVWKTYMDSSGNFYLGGTGGALQWVAGAGSLAITGTINVTGGNASTTTYAEGVAASAQSTAISTASSDATTKANAAISTASGDATTKANAAAAASLDRATFLDSGPGTIKGTLITSSSITTSRIAANTIVAGNIAANTITAAKIAAGTITATEIASNTITAAKIAAGTITTTQLNFTPATSTNIIATINASAEGIQITGARIAVSGSTTFSAGYDPSAAAAAAAAANSNANGRIAAAGAAADVNANVTTINGGKLTALSVTSSQIAAETITGGKIAAGTINATRLIANTITGDQIAANTITANKMDVSTLAAITANLGTVTAGTINSDNFVLTGMTSVGSSNQFRPICVSAGGVLQFGSETRLCADTGMDLTVATVTSVGLAAVNTLEVDGQAALNGSIYFGTMDGGGNKFLCVDNAGLVYDSAVACN